MVTDPRHRWARTQMISESIAASRRVLAKSEATLRRARAAVTRAEALLQRIYKLCEPYPALISPPPRVSWGGTTTGPAATRNADEESEFRAVTGR
jgi:hypothetical protein